MNKDQDINNQEWEKLYLPYCDNLNKYLISFVLPQVIVFQLANAHYRGCLSKSTLEQHFNSMRNIFNVMLSLNDIKVDMVEILKIKYNLKITNEKPLVLEKWK